MQMKRAARPTKMVETTSAPNAQPRYDNSASSPISNIMWVTSLLVRTAYVATVTSTMVPAEEKNNESFSQLCQVETTTATATITTTTVTKCHIQYDDRGFSKMK